MDFKLIVVVALGLSLGISMAFYARFYTHYILRGKNKAIKLILALLFAGVILAAIVISGYISSSDLFKDYNTKGGRTAFVLLWGIPFIVTSIVGLLRLIKEGR